MLYTHQRTVYSVLCATLTVHHRQYIVDSGLYTVHCTHLLGPAQALRDADAANTAYSTALALFQALPEGWVSWGTHCDQMYQSSKNTTWLDYAVTCYLQARCHAGMP